jgi:hypothetical protein
MRVRSTRRPSARRRTGAAIVATAVVSMLLVVATSGTTTSAAPVNATIATSCTGRDKATNDTLALAKGLIGSDRVAVNLLVTGGDVPETAGLEQDINAAFNWAATMDQNLIDQAAALIPSITVSNINATQQVKGPASEDTFTGSNAGPVNIVPKAGVPAQLPIGTIGGTVTTTGGGIITYRVGALTLDVKLSVTGVGDFDLKLTCEVQGSNIIAKTTVRDPDAPVFNPEVVQLDADANETVSVDLLGDVITPGKTPLLPESLKIVEQPSGGTASISDGVLSFTAPATAGTYTTTVEVCGAPKDEAGTPGVNETQLLTLGENWTGVGTGGGLPIVGQALNPRPVAFTLKVGGEETGLIWTAEHALLPPIFPMPLDGKTPTPENWAPATSPGLVNKYATDTRYKGVSPAEVQSALEKLPSIGAGNVQVEAVNGNTEKPNLVTALKVTYVGAKGEQDIPSVELGQWYSVPPQEVLDRISAVISGLAGSLGGEPDPDAPPPSEFENFIDTLDPNTPADQAAADKAMGDKILASIVSGTPVPGSDWSAYILFKLNIGALIPQLTAFLNSLFPQKIAASTFEQGEAPTPPQPLCAQGIVQVTVAEVQGETVVPPPAVAGSSQTQGIGFVG